MSLPSQHPILPRMPHGDPCMITPETWNTLADMVERATKLAVTGPGCSIRDTPSGKVISIFPQEQGYPDKFIITGTQTAGGFYTANCIIDTTNTLTSSNTTVDTSHVWTQNTTFTYTLMNTCEVGTTFHFLSINQYVIGADTTSLFDTNGSLAVVQVNIMPNLLRVSLACINYSSGNGTATAGGSATYNTLQYAAAYNGTTLATSLTATSRFAGSVIAASSGLVQVGTNMGGTFSFTLYDKIEQIGGPACSS